MNVQRDAGWPQGMKPTKIRKMGETVMAERIDSPANKKIKQMESLLLRKHRQKAGLFRVEGVRLAEMAAESGWEIAFGLYTQELAEKERGSRLLASLQGLGPLYEISEQLARRVAATDTPQGIFLVMRQPAWRPMELRTTGSALYVVLDGVQDPGNAGTIIRTADAIGADGVILTKGSVDIYSDKVVRASMGSIFHLPILQDVEPAVIGELAKREGWQLLATALDETAQPLFAADFRQSSAIIFGNEGQGVSKELLAVAQKVYIPMYGRAESLNVGVSAAVVLYEAVRQRRF